MARTRAGEPDDEDGDDDYDADYDAEFDYDPEDPETYPEGVYVDNGRETVPCPHCRAEIDEESEQCPRCGMYLSREDAPSQRGPVMMVLLLLALVAAAMLAGC